MLTYYQAKTNADCKCIASLYSPRNSKYMFTKKATTAEVRKKLSLPNRKSYILVLNKKNIGVFNIVLATNSKEARIGIVIDKLYQGKGYGKQAMKLIEKEAKKLKIKKLLLEVFTENKRAVSLYQKSGYKEVGKMLAMEKKI